MDQETVEERTVYVNDGKHTYAHVIGRPAQGWVSTITTNTDGEVKIKFYYDDGLIQIY